jgi:ABC-type uncharacterized transport system permease subunit
LGKSFKQQVQRNSFLCFSIVRRTVPAEAMLGRSQVVWLVGAGALALGLLLASGIFWRFALRFYTSASS